MGRVLLVTGVHCRGFLRFCTSPSDCPKKEVQVDQTRDQTRREARTRTLTPMVKPNGVHPSLSFSDRRNRDMIHGGGSRAWARRWLLRLRCTASGPQLQGSLGSIGLRPMPPHCSRDPAHGPGVGSGPLPRLPPPTCARPVSGVGLGPRCYPASLLWSPGPRPSPVFRSAICDCLSLNVSVSQPGRRIRILACRAVSLNVSFSHYTHPPVCRPCPCTDARPPARVTQRA